LSTSEAEFVATSQAGQKALYLRETLKDFGYQQQIATKIYGYNLACVGMSENPARRVFPRLLISAAISCANSSRLVLSKSYLCAHVKLSQMLSPRFTSTAFIRNSRKMMGQMPFALKFLRS